VSGVTTIDLMLLQAARGEELTYDGDLPYGIRWYGTVADFDAANRVENLRIDGLLDWDDHIAGPVALTHGGRQALMRGLA
jgi:hypothetical protein